MVDIDKVIAALECLSQDMYCACCSYGNYHECKPKVAEDALELLRFFRDKMISENECQLSAQEGTTNDLLNVIRKQHENEERLIDELNKTFLK